LNNNRGNNNNRRSKKHYDSSSEEIDNDEDDDNNDVCTTHRSSTASKNKNKSSYHRRNRKNKDDIDDECYEENFQWQLVSIPSVDPDKVVKARFYNGKVSLNSMVGFNNTGNVRLWPSEEIMTYFCAKNSHIFEDKSVCELGGGMSSLAGLMISKYSKPMEVFLTDGNESSFENLEVICSENEFECSVECCLLQWDKRTNYGDLENRFDYIVCADCLFFDEFRDDLCATIYKLLKMNGMCLIFAPNRKNTFHKFVDMAKLHFECMIVHDYDLDVWEKHLYEKDCNRNYDEDIHYPLLLKLKKRTKDKNDYTKMVL